MNKKCEVRASYIMYTMVIAISILATFSFMLKDITENYGTENVDEFNYYASNESDYTEFKEYTDKFAKSQNYQEDAENVENRSIPYKAKVWIGGKLESVSETFPVAILLRGYQSVKMFMDLMTYGVKSAYHGINNIGVEVPTPIIFMLISIVGITIVIVFVRALWEKKI